MSVVGTDMHSTMCFLVNLTKRQIIQFMLSVRLSVCSHIFITGFSTRNQGFYRSGKTGKCQGIFIGLESRGKREFFAMDLKVREN